MSTNRARRVAKEVADIHSDTTSNILADPVGGGDDLTHLKGSFKGPPGTPYEGGTYMIDIKIPSEYPFRPPIMKFDTKVWHPNVSSQTVSTQGRQRIDLLLWLTSTLPQGCHLPRYSLLRLVSSPHHQIRPSLPPIASQYTGTQRPSRCRGSGYAHA